MGASSDTISVLHVDDEPAFADLAMAFVEREDDRFEGVTATSAAAALDHLAEREFDCVVSDYDMPNQNGLEFLESLYERGRDLPFILFTGKGSEEIASEAISMGVTDYLQKQSGTDQYTILANRIKNSVEARRAQIQRQRQLEAIETAQEGISILDGDGRFIYVNRSYADLYGYEFEELIGEHWELLYRDEDIPSVREEILPVVEETGHWHGTTTGLRSDGRTFVEDHNLTTTDHGELVCTVRDITERRARDRELERIHDFFTEAERLGNLGAWEFDANGSVVWTDGTRRIHGVDDEFDPTVEEGIEFFHPDDRNAIRQAVEGALRTGDPYDVQARLITANGTERWVRTHGEPIDGDGEQNAVRGFMQDITEQKERERELREAKSRLEDAIGAGAVGTWEWDVREDALVVGPEFAGTFGVDSDDARSGAPLERFVSSIHEDDLDRVEREIEAAMDACGTYEEEYRVRNADGEFRWVLARGHVECDEDGDPVTFPGALTDITYRKRVEQELQRHQAFLEESTDIIVVLDEDGTIEYVSPSVEWILGYEPGDLIGTNAFDYAHPEDADELLATFHDLIDQPGASDRAEARFRTADGGRCWLEHHVTNQLENSSISGIVINSREITEQKEYERRLERQHETLEEFAGVVSHDLQTPIDTVRGRLELANDTGDIDHVNAALSALDRVDELRRELVDVLRTGEVVGEIESVDVGKIADPIWKTINAPDEASLQLVASPRIEGDRNAIRRLLQNLLSNSVERGDAAVRIRIGGLDDGFYVEDDGPEIPPERRSEVFEPRFTTNAGGSGMGLASVRQIVEAHGWQIRIEDARALDGVRFAILTQPSG